MQLFTFIMSVLQRLRDWAVVPLVYAHAAYCCAVEFFLDVFCDMPLKLRADEWSRSSLLREHPQRRRVAVMTGADGTIGTEVSRLLLEFGFEVAIFGLRRPRLEFLKDWERLHLFKCDLLVPNQVHAALNDFQRRFEDVDLVVFNAGVMLHPPLGEPKAVDPHFTVNVLAHALMLDVLRPFLERSPRAAPKAIAVSSTTLRFGDLRAFLDGDPARAFRRYSNGYKSYCDSKLLASVYFRHEAERAAGSKLRLASVHPGVVPGALYRHVFPPARFLINQWLKFLLRKSSRAAIEVLSLAFNDHIRSGCFYEHTSCRSFEEFSRADLRRLHEAVQDEIR